MKHALLKEDPNSLERKGYEKLLIDFFQNKVNRYLQQFFGVNTNLYLTSSSFGSSETGILDMSPIDTAHNIQPHAEVVAGNSAPFTGELWLESLLIITKARQKRLERVSRKYQEDIDKLKEEMISKVVSPDRRCPNAYDEMK